MTVFDNGLNKHRLRSGVAAALVATAAGGAAVTLLTGPAATAAPDPCATSEIARTIGKVATDTGDYLDAHPQTNQALTTITQQGAGPQSLAAVKTYLDANPEVAKDMQQLQQPLQSLGARCQLPVTLPQLMGLMQAAQQQGAALPSGLPGTQSTAQNVGIPSAAIPARSAPASSVTGDTGPLPGPPGTTTR